uniref:Putative secreted protein n=1 Tax=Anopheles triannulatus TaxID=58253 RepID=A0A2M4B538_9DIPT
MKNTSPPPDAIRSSSRCLAFFLMCFCSGSTGCGLVEASAPCEYFFIGGRWKARSFIGPMCVGMNGARSSTTGVECCSRLPPPTLIFSVASVDLAM